MPKNQKICTISVMIMVKPTLSAAVRDGEMALYISFGSVVPALFIMAYNAI